MTLHYKMHWCQISKQVTFIALKKDAKHTLQTKPWTKRDVATVWNDLTNDIHTFISLTHFN